MKRLPINAKKIRDMYRQGLNIMSYLRELNSQEKNVVQTIEISYDLQSGDYTDAMKNPAYLQYKINYCQSLANHFSCLEQYDSIMEAGIGEATTLATLLDCLPKQIKSYGFDLSWSRIAYANKWLRSKEHNKTQLCTGDLFNIPFLDNSIDVVYTSHSIEPNGGNEEAILRELYRVAKKYVVLLEPAYEFANDQARQRMESHGYCKELKKTCDDLGYKVIKNQLFEYSSNVLNPTMIIIIEKLAKVGSVADVFACPLHKTPLRQSNNALYSEEALSLYPIIDDIPCLRIENGILASHFEDFKGN